VASLTAAFERLKDAYAFESTVTVGAEVATRAVGTWVDGTSEVEVESGAATVTYRSLPPRAWVREGDDGDWVELAGDAPTDDPLDGLRSPSTVSLAALVGDAVELLATYPAASLGLRSEAPVTVSLTLGGDESVVARYETDVAGQPATAQTTMRPLANATPIPAPSLGP
jgi:hypothetical protein